MYILFYPTARILYKDEKAAIETLYFGNRKNLCTCFACTDNGCSFVWIGVNIKMIFSSDLNLCIRLKYV